MIELLVQNISQKSLNRQGTLALPDYTTAQLDEPFGALDALTCEIMASELLYIWQERCKTVFMVTHDSGEAVYLADQVLAFSDMPAKITLDLKIDLRSCTVPRCATPRNLVGCRGSFDLLLVPEKVNDPVIYSVGDHTFLGCPVSSFIGP